MLKKLTLLGLSLIFVGSIFSDESAKKECIKKGKPERYCNKLSNCIDEKIRDGLNKRDADRICEKQMGR